MTNGANSDTFQRKAVELARRQVRQAVLEIIRATSGQMTTRPMFGNRPELDLTITDADPMVALRAATAFKFATRRLTMDYARQGRENGHDWQEIGTALGFDRLAESGISVADAAYDYATGNTALSGRSFAWVCPECRGTVIDRGPEAGSPADCEEGHASGCRRLATAIAAWDASWEADGEPR